MSSGFGTQQNDSRDEPTYAESFELRTICPTNSTETDPEAPLLQRGDSTDMDNHGSSCDAYLQYQRSLVPRSPSYKKSLDRLSLLSTRSSEEDDDDEMQETVKKQSNTDIVEQQQQQETAPYRYDENSIFQTVRMTPRQRRDLPRMASDHSINTLSNEQDELMTRQSNLRDELLNCEKKELFQFLSDDFDTSNNYFSDTVGYGSALIDPDTDSLVLDNTKLKDDTAIFSPPRKTSSSSIRSNFSYISNSIFAALEHRRGGSISESIDRMLTRSVSNSKVGGADIEDCEPLVSDSEFENIIASFEKELYEIKKSTPSLNRKLSISSEDRSGSASGNGPPPPPQIVAAVHKRTNSGGDGDSRRSPRNHHQYEQLPSATTTTTTRRANTIGCMTGNGGTNRESVKLKRRSLEKQSNIDDGFSVSNEIRKICDHMNAPFAAMDSRQLMVAAPPTTTSNGGAIPSMSPNLRRKSDFHSSFDRIKRTSLIERVDEAADEDQLHHGISTAVERMTTKVPTRIVSEKLPRKHLSTDLKLDSISLKSTGSYENLLCHREQKHHQLQRIQFKDTKEEQDEAGDVGGLKSSDDPKSPSKSPKKGKNTQLKFL